MKCRRTIFHARMDTVRSPQEACQDTLRQTCVFVSGVICRSRSSFVCIRGTKRRCTIFHARVDTVRITQEARQDTLCRTYVFAFRAISVPRSSFGCIQAQNVDALFSLLRWAQCGSHKKHTGTRYAELVFLRLILSVANIVRSGASGV
jgi:hypothetical protein